MSKPTHALYLLPSLRPEARCRHCGARIFWVYELNLWLDGTNAGGPKGQTPQVHEHKFVCAGSGAVAWRPPVEMPAEPLTDVDREAAMVYSSPPGQDVGLPEWL